MAVIHAHNFSLVWLKRDLRLRDHEPLCKAIALKQPLIIAYIIEPMMLNDPHMQVCHWRFIYQSLQDLNEQLAPINTKVYVYKGDAATVLHELQNVGLLHIFSHQEIGLKHTYDRDMAVQDWCHVHNIHWHQANYGAVSRPLSHRKNWRRLWRHRISSAVQDPDLRFATFNDVIIQS